MLRGLVSVSGRPGSLSGIAASAAVMPWCKPNGSVRVKRNKVSRDSDLACGAPNLVSRQDARSERQNRFERLNHQGFGDTSPDKHSAARRREDAAAA